MKDLLFRLGRFLRRPELLPVIIGAAVGPIVAQIVYSVTDLQGRGRFLTIGAMIGLVIGWVFSIFRRSTQGLLLSEMTLSIPEFSEFKFMLNSEYRRVAWKLFVETMTRIATQPLPPEHGFIREALNSLHSLFATTRDLLKAMEPTRASKGTTVEMLAMQMLNKEIRPFLAKWHPLLKQFESSPNGAGEVAWPHSAACRGELDLLRLRLITYGKAFGELAGVQQLAKYFEVN